MDGWVKRRVLLDHNDEQGGRAEYDSHACDQSKIYPLFRAGVVGGAGFFYCLPVQDTSLPLELQQFLPHSFGFLAEEHDLVLPFVKIEAQAVFVIGFRLAISRTCYMVHMHQHAAALGVGAFDESHRGWLPFYK